MRPTAPLRNKFSVIATTSLPWLISFSLDRSRGNQRFVMFRFVAFLRAINVGGGRTVKMQYLCQVFESLGFSNVATFIASGNVVFETTTKETKALERRIEKALKTALGYEVRTFVRGEAELAKIAGYRPFPRSKFDETWHSNIIFLADNLNEKLKQSVNALGTNMGCVRGPRTGDLLAVPQETEWSAVFYRSPGEGSRFGIHRPRGEHNKKDRLKVLFVEDSLNARHHAIPLATSVSLPPPVAYLCLDTADSCDHRLLRNRCEYRVLFRSQLHRGRCDVFLEMFDGAGPRYGQHDSRPPQQPG